MNLIIESLNFSYRNEEVFKDLNLNFKSGVLNLISGPSGSGKTMMLLVKQQILICLVTIQLKII